MAKHNNTGGLWRNKYKEAGDKRPDYVGEITIAGITHKISAWNSASGGGRPDISIKVNEEYKTPTPAKPVDLSGVSDTELPF